MNIKLIIITILILHSFELSAQIAGLSKSQIVENKIAAITATLEVSSDNPTYKKLVVREFKFDKWGNCIRSKYLYPFYDVVATADKYFTNFDSVGNVIKKIRIHKTVGISKQGKEYIQLFGETNDTTITINSFNKFNQIIKEKTFTIGESDTIVTNYKYEEGVLVESIHYNTKVQGELNSENYIRRYEYDGLNRKVKVFESPTKITGESQKIISYIGSTSKIKSIELSNDFRWVTHFKNGKKSISVNQDTLNGRKEIFEYDKFGNLVNETTYKDLTDSLTNFYGKTYKYKDHLLIEESSFNKSSSIINLTDKIQYLYNKDGLLKEVRFIYDNEKRRSHHYEYKFRN